MLGAVVSSYPWVSGAAQVYEDPGPAFGTVAAAVTRQLRDLPHEVRDEDIERDKAGHRGLFLAELRGILDRCNQGDPDDPRWDELRLRTLDRFAKLARIYEPDAASGKSGPGNPKDLASAAAAALDELEASRAEVR